MVLSNILDICLSVIPQINPFEFESEVNTGEGVQLTCYVGKGDMPLTISWSFNSKPIKNIFGVSTVPVGSRTNLLIINSVQPEHAGVYQCQAGNPGGMIEHNAELFVNGIDVFGAHIFIVFNALYTNFFSQFIFVFICLPVTIKYLKYP